MEITDDSTEYLGLCIPHTTMARVARYTLASVLTQAYRVVQTVMQKQKHHEQIWQGLLHTEAVSHQ